MSDRQRMMQYVIGNAGALLVGLLSAYFAVVLSGTADTSAINLRIADLMEYVSAAQLILHGHGAQLYDVAALGHVQSRIVGQPASHFGVLPYLYPPHLAIAMAPLAALPYMAAYVIWLAVDCVLLALVLFHLESYAQLQGRRALAFRAIALSFLPVFMALGLGQASILLLALFTLSFMAARAGRYGWAGAALALAFLKPVYVLPMLLVFVVRGHWRALASFCLTGCGLAAISLPIVGLDGFRGYIDLAQQVTHWQGRSIHGGLWYHHTPIAATTYAPEWNHSLAGFAELLSPRHGELLAAALCIGLLALVVTCARSTTTIDLPLGMAVAAGLLVSPHTLAYDLTILLLPVTVALRYRHRAHRSLPPLLALGYITISVGYKLVFFVPVQITVIAASALTLWLFAVSRRSEAPAQRPVEPAVPALAH